MTRGDEVGSPLWILEFGDDIEPKRVVVVPIQHSERAEPEGVKLPAKIEFTAVTRLADGTERSTSVDWRTSTIPDLSDSDWALDENKVTTENQLVPKGC